MKSELILFVQTPKISSRTNIISDHVLCVTQYLGDFHLIFRITHPPSLKILEILIKCRTDALCRTNAYHTLLEALIGRSVLLVATAH